MLTFRFGERKPQEAEVIVIHGNGLRDRHSWMLNLTLCTVTRVAVLPCEAITRVLSRPTTAFTALVFLQTVKLSPFSWLFLSSNKVLIPKMSALCLFVAYLCEI